MAGIDKALHGKIETDDGVYSELKVMRSAAGYYIGREFTEKDSTFTEPGSRESGYYKNEHDAAVDLESNSFEWRAAIENVAFYEGKGYNIESERTSE